jgi:hypothetical protein
LESAPTILDHLCLPDDEEQHGATDARDVERLVIAVEDEDGRVQELSDVPARSFIDPIR